LNIFLKDYQKRVAFIFIDNQEELKYKFDLDFSAPEPKQIKLDFSNIIIQAFKRPFQKSKLQVDDCIIILPIHISLPYLSMNEDS
jgi:hypothetical protein